ncbi:dolichyl-phosphate-mannose-protein mannosyltransferase [Sphaerotilus hippei]|uniref:Dolichyl-phosphate-mannose-protein mannosyltransferase n=1 Tax=Sphaerotilus hippei TaxID=744406 RepID=A0A318GZI6_9BURK|nr:glycosyltransferase family 39 protein [Sphaerotilus hippei]PXW95803.1 dolichyl-phosphate-mannose-protein mannosyltransferase [Sphaerotilus hippei]
MNTSRSAAVAPPVPGWSAPHLMVLVLLLALLFLLRVVVLAEAMAPGDLTLQVDEAQYWHWSRDLQWGYYSKPPVIAALIAASTALFGNGLVGLKLLTVLAYPLTAAVLAAWARDLALAVVATPADASGARQAAGWADRVGLLAAALFMTSPIAGLLGLAVTTDAPLLLCWALAGWRLWAALERGQRRDWLWLGVFAALGILSKYTMLAMAAGLLVLLPTHGQRGPWWAWPGRDGGVPLSLLRARLQGLMMTGGVVLLMLLPHLAWNADHGWPTLQHTVEITAESQRGSGRSPASSLAEFVGGQWLQFGPFWLLLLMALGVARLARRGPPAAAAAPLALAFDPSGWARARRFALWLALPLLAVGLTQAWHSRAQLNWTAPAAHGLFLWASLGLARRWPAAPVPAGAAALPALRWLPAALVAGMGLHVLLTTAVPLAGPIARHFGRAPDQPLPRQWDIWVRMRAWGPAYARLAPTARDFLRQHPQAQILGMDRQVISMGSYQWRELLAGQPELPGAPGVSRRWITWTPPGQRFAQDHFQLTTRWAAAGSPAAREPLLIVSAAELPAGLLARLDEPRLLAEVVEPDGAGRTLRLRLWAASRRDAQGTAP